MEICDGLEISYHVGECEWDRAGLLRNYSLGRSCDDGVEGQFYVPDFTREAKTAKEAARKGGHPFVWEPGVPAMLATVAREASASVSNPPGEVAGAKRLFFIWSMEDVLEAQCNPVFILQFSDPKPLM